MKRIILMCCALSMCIAPVSYALETGAELDTITVSDEVQSQDIESDSSTAMTLASLSLFASGVIAPMYLVWCSDQPSAWIYAGTAGVYVGAEAMNWSKYKDASNRAMVGYRHRERESQIASLTAASEQTRAASKAAGRKATFAKVAAAGYAVASGVAVMEQMEFWKKGGACANKGKLFSHYELNRDQKIYRHHYELIERSNDGQDAMARFKEFTNLVAGSKSSPTLREYESYRIYKNNLGLKEQLLFSVQGIAGLIDRADAGFGDTQMEKMGIGLGLAGAAALTIWNDQVMSLLPEWASKVASSGVTRAVVFGAHSAIALSAGVMTSNAASDINKRADQYDTIISQLKAPSNTQNVEGVVDPNALSQDEINQSLLNKGQVVETEKLDNMGCLVTKDGLVVADEGCDCKKNQTCRVADLPKIQFSSFDMPAAFNKTLSGMKDISRNLGQGHYGKAVASAGSVTGNAAQIGKINGQLEKELNKRLVKEGKQPVDMEKMKKQAMNAFNKGVGTALRNVSPDVAKEMLNISMGSSDLSAVDTALKNNKVAEEKLSSIKTTEGKSKNGVIKGAAKDAKISDPFADMNFDVASNNQVKAEAQSTDQGYDYDGEAPNDISNRSDTTLFEQLSNRYIKTAYPRLFKEYN